MVLVAPHPLQRSVGGGGQVAAPGGAELLALLRGDASARPRFDPGLAGGLRAWLEDAAYGVVASRGDLVPPLVLGPWDVLGPVVDPPAVVGAVVDRAVVDRAVVDGAVVDRAVVDGAVVDGAVLDGPADSLQKLSTESFRACEGEPRVTELSHEALLSRLIHVLFRLSVTGATIGDPLHVALEALAAEGSSDVVRQCGMLGTPAKAALAETVAAHATHLVDLLPRLASGWMPRTDDRVAIPLAGGQVVLQGVFDLLVGVPRPGTASLCALGLTTGGPWARERRSLHYLALLETLRSGVPPFRLALIESATGRYGVEDVREDHLRAIASHLTAWLSTAASRGFRRADA